MADRPIEIGDRVYTLQMPGVFLVVARRGMLIDLESDTGIHLTVSDASVRRVAPAPIVVDAGDGDDTAE
jgi:hypothetical protein